MDEAAPITWLIGQINAIVTAGAGAVATALAGTISPLVSVCLGIYMILISVNYLRGAETEPVFDFGLRMASWALIIGCGLNAATYVSTVIPIVTGLGPDLANAATGGTVTAGALDQLALHYFRILDEGYESANAPVFPFNVGPLLLYMLKALLILVGLIPFLVAATVAMVVAGTGSVMVAMVGPIFFAFLLFPATRQYFSAWINTVLSYALIPLLVAVVATISVGLSKMMFASGGGATLDDVSLKTVFYASCGNLILLFLLKQVAQLASSLSAGGVNASMPGTIGTMAQVIRQGAMGSAREIAAGARGYRGARNAAALLANRWANRNNSITRKAG